MQIGTGWSSNWQTFGAGDLTGDGNPDILVCRSDINALELYIGNGTGGIGSITTDLTGCDNETFVGLTDYDNDGTLDLLVRDNSSGDIIVDHGTGTGWLKPNTATIAGGW